MSQNASVVLEIASENLPSNTYFFVIIASDDVDTAVVEGSFTVKGKWFTCYSSMHNYYHGNYLSMQS